MTTLSHWDLSFTSRLSYMHAHYSHSFANPIHPGGTIHPLRHTGKTLHLSVQIHLSSSNLFLTKAPSHSEGLFTIEVLYPTHIPHTPQVNPILENLRLAKSTVSQTNVFYQTWNPLWAWSQVVITAPLLVSKPPGLNRHLYYIAASRIHGQILWMGYHLLSVNQSHAGKCHPFLS